MIIGVGDIQCDTYTVNFVSGSVTASVNISLVNDDVPECDETFTASITVPGEGFRLGSHPSASITIKDEGIVLFHYNSILCQSPHLHALHTWDNNIIGIEAVHIFVDSLVCGYFPIELTNVYLKTLKLCCVYTECLAYALTA